MKEAWVRWVHLRHTSHPYNLAIERECTTISCIRPGCPKKLYRIKKDKNKNWFCSWAFHIIAELDIILGVMEK